MDFGARAQITKPHKQPNWWIVIITQYFSMALSMQKNTWELTFSSIKKYRPKMKIFILIRELFADFFDKTARPPKSYPFPQNPLVYPLISWKTIIWQREHSKHPRFLLSFLSKLRLSPLSCRMRRTLMQTEIYSSLFIMNLWSCLSLILMRNERKVFCAKFQCANIQFPG